MTTDDLLGFLEGVKSDGSPGGDYRYKLATIADAFHRLSFADNPDSKLADLSPQYLAELGKRIDAVLEHLATGKV